MTKQTSYLHRMTYAAALLCLTAGPAAHASATMIETCDNGSTGPAPHNCGYESQVISQAVSVSVTTESENVDQVGAIYIGARTDGNIRGVFSQNGWAGFQGGLFPPTTTFDSMPSSTQTYAVFGGGMLCGQLGSGKHELWASYGVLNAQGQAIVDNSKSRVSKGISEEHLKQTYIQNEMQRSEHAWLVFAMDCAQSG